jgi:triphosphoribosyl-dephospho-CoA synthase
MILTPGTLAALVCSLEVAAPKPGNVHRGIDFDDLTLEDFLVSGSILGQVIDELKMKSVGETILKAVIETRARVGTNTNLGIALLLVPLAKCLQWHLTKPNSQLSPSDMEKVLSELSQLDAEQVYEAIKLANPGGMGVVETADLHSSEPVSLSLVEAMALAADRDIIARQYTNQFEEVFGIGTRLLTRGRKQFSKLGQAIVFAHLGLMAEFPDSLIARKCGLPEAQTAQQLARRAFDSLQRQDQVDEEMDWSQVAELDFWLRAKGNRRNPGTTADLIAASLFVAIQNQLILAPFR